MKEAKTGIYFGPLRLLAMEVFDSVNQEVCHPPHTAVCCSILCTQALCNGKCDLGLNPSVACMTV